MDRRGIRCALFMLVLAVVLGAPSFAFAFDESGSGYACAVCHVAPSDTTSSGTRYGPHGHYLTTTSRCASCHTVHNAPSGNKLLPGQTLTDTCLTCHDGTSANGGGVYGAIAARTADPNAVKASHSIDTTSVVPGGSASTGGSASLAFRGVNGTLTCADCHSPHGTDCVTPFLGERQRSWEFYRDYHGELTVQTQNRLLRRKPGTSEVAVDEYGSDWCGACHAGRISGIPDLRNHPVESAVTQPDPALRYSYRQLGIIDVGPYPTANTVLGPAGINTKPNGFNRAYLMPYPRVGAQLGHYPICQQCHEDARTVGSLDTTGTLATPSAAIVSQPDGRVDTDNPRFQNFPHETTNPNLLVELEDDLCLNCHPPAALP